MMSGSTANNNGADIIFAASCNVDLISYVNRMPLIGETLMGQKFQMGFGGKGANKAIACSRLGSRCSVIAKLGNDTFGRDYFENFKKNGINTDRVLFTDDAATGVAPICVDENGNNSIIVILGANLLLSSDDISSCENLFRNSKMLVTNLELPLKTVVTALKLAKLNKLTTLLNFAPATDIIENELFTNTDYLILNEVEASQLSKTSDIKNVEDAKKVGLKLIDMYKVQVGIIITLGEMGVLFTDKLTRNSFHKKCNKVNVVDSTGAGDAFVGSFAHYLNLLGKDSIEKAIDLSSDYATLTVQKRGTQLSYPSLNELDSKFKI